MARLQRFQEMQRRDGAARAVRFFALDGYNQCRPAGLLHDARSYNADDTPVPAVSIEHHAELTSEIRLSGEPLLDLGYDARFFALAIQVQLIQFGGDLPASRLVFAGKQFDHIASHVHAPGSVDPRSQ